MKVVEWLNSKDLNFRHFRHFHIKPIEKHQLLYGFKTLSAVLGKHQKQCHTFSFSSLDSDRIDLTNLNKYWKLKTVIPAKIREIGTHRGVPKKVEAR